MNACIRRATMVVCLLHLSTAGLVMLSESGLRAAELHRKPVILDTDIGDDIDDTWALGLLLKSPELDLKLVVGDYGKSAYRAKVAAKFLQTVGRTDVPVGLGIRQNEDAVGPQAAWVKDYDLKSYPGKIHEDGVRTLIDMIMSSPERVTLIAIGPLPNIAEALKREPKIAERADFVGMHGSVRKGYEGNATPSPEWNVKADAASCQAVFQAPWKMTITPLDTCGLVVLDGGQYARVRDSKDIIASTIVANYRIWSKDRNEKNDVAERRSSTLFDTVAVYLAASHDLCKMEQLGIRVTSDGFTRIDPSAKTIQVATEWKDLNAYREFLVSRLTGSSKP